MQRANDLLAGMQEQRDAANNRIVHLLADLKSAMRHLEAAKSEIETLKNEASGRVLEKGPRGVAELDAKAGNAVN